MYTGGMAEFKTLRQHNPWFLDQWDYDKNDKTPETISWSSGLKVTWVCEKGHNWVTSPNQRVTYNTGCPFCSNRKVLEGYNDLASTHPEFLDIWDYEANDKTPTQIVAGSKYKAQWNWHCGHTTRSQVNQVVIEGYKCGACSGRYGAVKGNSLSESSPELLKEWHPDNRVDPLTLTRSSGFRALWKCGSGHEWEATVNDRVSYSTGCARCQGRAGTGKESEVANLLESWGVEVIRGDRKTISGFELDILVPEKGVAVEFNGLYWHSDKFKARDYHKDKTEAANSAGIQLIHVWEDDWDQRREVVEKMLAAKLGVSEQERKDARKLSLVSLSSREARKFLDENHVQGFTGGTKYFALQDTTVRAVIVMKSTGKPGEYRLDRYATSCIVRGGFTRLLKYATRQLGATTVITFSDNAVSKGGIYESHGFTRDGELAPDYQYIVSGKREHKFNYRLKRFKTDPNLKYEEGLTERQLADLNKLLRVYDAGKVRWVWRAKMDS